MADAQHLFRIGNAVTVRIPGFWVGHASVGAEHLVAIPYAIVIRVPPVWVSANIHFFYVIKPIRIAINQRIVPRRVEVIDTQFITVRYSITISIRVRRIKFVRIFLL